MPRWRALSSSDQPVVTTQRWRLDLAYDGNGLSGFAFQPEFTTVVGLLRATLASTLHLDEEPVVVGAGRTDAGVHAFAQVVHVDLPTKLFAKNRGPDPERLTQSLNKQLRGRIQIVRAQPVSTDFHARFSAQWREYRYLVLEAKPPALAFTNAWSWTVEGPLDVELMNVTCAEIAGTHDFRAFCRRPTNSPVGEPLLRHVINAHWERLEDGWGMSPGNAPCVRLTIRAQSFCHNMVRCLTSTMVAIGQGRLDQNTVKERLESLERVHLPPAAPAGGLSLVGVGYDQFAGGPSGFVR
jgi:tRNA pseudouridine38-40 synthase